MQIPQSPKSPKSPNHQITHKSSNHQITHKSPNHQITHKSYTLTPIPKRSSPEKTDDWAEWSSKTSQIDLSETSQNKIIEQNLNKDKKPIKDDPDLMKILSDLDQKKNGSKISKNSGNSVVSLEDLAFKKKVPNYKN